MESNHPSVGLPRPDGFEEGGAESQLRLNKGDLGRGERRGKTFGNTCAAAAV